MDVVSKEQVSQGKVIIELSTLEAAEVVDSMVLVVIKVILKIELFSVVPIEETCVSVISVKVVSLLEYISQVLHSSVSYGIVAVLSEVIDRIEEVGVIVIIMLVEQIELMVTTELLSEEVKVVYPVETVI